MADTAFLALVILSLLLNLLVYTPILSYWIFKVVKYRDSFVIKKRLPTLLIALIALSILYFSIEKSIQLFTMGDIMNASSKLLLNKIIFYIFQIPFIYFLWFYALRFWLLYYKLEWSLSMMNNEWKSIIHHNNASDDWFIIHRQQYGSLRYLQKKLIIAVSLITILGVLSWILYWESIEPNGVFVWMIYTVFIFAPPTCILFYVAYKLPHYDDYLALKDELKYTCYGFIIVIFILILFFAIINSVQGLSSSPYLSLLLWHIIILWNFTMITLHTHWVVRRFDHVLRRTRYSDASLFSDINKVTTNKVKHNKPAKVNKIAYKLQQILIHPKSYDLFMHHLWKEHSSECLLSSTEFIQFQYLIFYHHQAMHINDHNDQCMNGDDCLQDKDLHQLHPDIPQSSIVFGANPTSKISAYIMTKLNGPSFHVSYVHKKSIAFNQTLSNLTRNIANTISPSRSKAKNLMNGSGGGSGKPILAMSAPLNRVNSDRKRHSLSGRLSKRNRAKTPKSKHKVLKHRRSLSSNKGIKLEQSEGTEDNGSNHKGTKHGKSHSAFHLQCELNINTSDLLQGFEPRSPPKPAQISSKGPFYKKPKKPQRTPPTLPDSRGLGTPPVVFVAMPSQSVEGTSGSEDITEPSLVINELKHTAHNTYSGIPMVTDDTPTLKAHYIDPNEPPLPPLKPLPLPPDPNADLDETVKTVQRKTISLRDRLNSLRHLRGNSGNSHGSGRIASGVFNDNDEDDDSFCTSDEEKGDSEVEDSVIMLYKAMDADELDQKKVELIRKYREIAYDLWVKYVKVGAEYEINIDYNTRKKFAKVMSNKEEWLDNDEFNEKELSMLFNPCVQRMFTFLSNSFTRFRDKPDFVRVQEFLVI